MVGIESLLLISAQEAEETSVYLRGLDGPESSPAVALQCLFGQCCLSMVPGAEIRLKELAAEAAALAGRILTSPDPNQLNLDPLLLIETDAVLRSACVEPAELRTLLGRVAEELAAQPSRVQHIGRVRHIAARLAALGFPIRVARPAKEIADMVRSPERWFGASVAELADLADHLLADAAGLDEIATRVLSLVALAELRNYRIDLGCTLLRVVLQLGEPCPESAEALNFIALQRRRDGRYGFPDQYAEAPAPGTDEHLAVYLPLTLNAVWLFRTDAERRERPLLVASA